MRGHLKWADALDWVPRRKIREAVSHRANSCRYVGNTAYNVYNKKACALIHAHWSVAFAQLVVSTVPEISTP